MPKRKENGVLFFSIVVEYVYEASKTRIVRSGVVGQRYRPIYDPCVRSFVQDSTRLSNAKNELVPRTASCRFRWECEDMQ